MEKALFAETPLLKSPSRVVDLPFNFKKADLTWMRHGYSKVPLEVKTYDNKIWDDRKSSGIFQYGLYRKICGRGYVMLPNEEVDVILPKVIKSLGPELGLEIFKTYTAYHGDAKYWEVRSNKKYTIPGSFRDNDKVQLGFIVRNSLACNVSFGMDVFTMCEVCTNGAVQKGSDLLSMQIKHYGKDSLKQMTENLERRVRDIMQEGVWLIEDYAKAAKLKFRLEAAKQIAKRVSVKYLPDYIEVDEKTHNVTLKKHNKTFWEVMNNITDPVWHNDELSFLTKSEMTNHLHRVMHKEIEVMVK
jgi:hypothetical protein